MPFSTYAGNRILDHLLRGVAITAPARVWVSLHTADPGGNGASEVGAGAWPAYARQDPAGGGPVANGFTAAASKASENASVILFPEHNGAGPVTVTHIGLWDALSGGNFLMGQALTASRIVNPADQMVIPVGQLDVTAV